MKTFLKMANPTQIEKLKEHYAFQLLAFQLHQHSVCSRIVDCLLSICFRRDITLFELK